MCNPVLMVGLSLAGTAIQAAGQIAQGENANEMGQLQQKAYDDQARAQAKASAYEQMQERRKQDLLLASGRAQVGASGVSFEGSPSDVLASNAAQGEMDIRAIEFGSTMKQNQLRTQGALARRQGQQAETAGYIAGASTLFSGASRAVQMGRSPFA